MAWTATTPDGWVTWLGDGLTGSTKVKDRVGDWLSGQDDPVAALPVCLEFPPDPGNEYATLIALYRLYGTEVTAPDAPWDEIIPPIPKGAVS